MHVLCMVGRDMRTRFLPCRTSSSRSTTTKKTQITARARGEIFAKGEYIRNLRLASRLADLRTRYANSRPPVPEASRSSVLTTFIYFLVLLGPKTMLICALVRTVSTQSKSVDGQRCGHWAIPVNLKARKLNRIYPV